MICPHCGTGVKADFDTMVFQSKTEISSKYRIEV